MVLCVTLFLLAVVLLLLLLLLPLDKLVVAPDNKHDVPAEWEVLMDCCNVPTVATVELRVANRKEEVLLQVVVVEV